jgi:hypothetical protein
MEMSVMSIVPGMSECHHELNLDDFQDRATKVAEPVTYDVSSLAGDLPVQSNQHPSTTTGNRETERSCLQSTSVTIPPLRALDLGIRMWFRRCH